MAEAGCATAPLIFQVLLCATPCPFPPSTTDWWRGPACILLLIGRKLKTTVLNMALSLPPHQSVASSGAAGPLSQSVAGGKNSAILKPVIFASPPIRSVAQVGSLHQSTAVGGGVGSSRGIWKIKSHNTPDFLCEFSSALLMLLCNT